MTISVKTALLTFAASAAVSAGLAAPAQAAPTAATAPVQRVAPAKASGGEVHVLARRSFKCKRNSRDVVNLSWKNGNISTKVYFNNHCNQRKQIRLIIKSGAITWHKDYWLPAKTKDHITFRHGVAEKVTNIKPRWTM